MGVSMTNAKNNNIKIVTCIINSMTLNILILNDFLSLKKEIISKIKEMIDDIKIRNEKIMVY